MVLDREKAILLFALFTRISTIIFQVFANNLIPDHKADAFSPEWEISGAGDHAIEVLLGGFRHWDAAHFLYIAEHGYTTEETFAFFPLYPMMLSLTKEQMTSQQLLSVMSMHSTILFLAVFTNVIFFVIAAVLLYKLGSTVLKDEQLAFKAALLFCINPAGIFMTAAYTESMFAAVSFLAMFLLEKNYIFPAAAVFAVSTATRSNGTVSCGFILYFLARYVIRNLVTVYKAKQLSVLIISLIRIFTKGLLSLVSVFLILSPFFIFQYYAYIKFCTDQKLFGLFDVVRPLTEMRHEYIDFQESGDFVDATPSAVFGKAPWCNNTPPLIYSYIQEKYWNVGLFQYYELKQIPNFLLALPMIILGCAAVWTYCTARWSHVKVLGLIPRKEKEEDAENNDRAGFYSDGVFVYLVHMASLLLFGILFMNIQVITRFLASSCPVIYWFVAAITTTTPANCSDSPVEDQDQNTEKNWIVMASANIVTHQIVNWKENNVKTNLILAYFLMYNILGTVLHCNFLPWT
ncbi:GPI mannosyltransferase 2-like [Ptychodera flava]|uniref:GPI mannosyltransferase 2-like n=1 Tax=Ptychodera flava TaxID=63121 RepID=UPI00396A75E3